MQKNGIILKYVYIGRQTEAPKRTLAAFAGAAAPS